MSDGSSGQTEAGDAGVKPAPETAEQGDATPPVDEQPRALSPLSVPYRAVSRGASVAFTLLFLVVSGSSLLGGTVGQLAGVALVGLAVVAIVAYEVVYWRRYEYAVTTDTFDIRSGVFRRRNREIPVDRIQNVDIAQNVVQRMLGVAEVDMETAGGGATEAAVRYVGFEEAKRLQRVLAARKRGADPTPEAADDDEPRGEVLFELAPRELGLVGLFSFDLRTPGVVVFLLYGLVTTRGAGMVPSVPGDGLTLVGLAVAAGALIVLFSWAAGGVAAVLNYYDFRLTRVDDELQYERGLLRRYDGSIPLDKVQTLTVLDDPLKRRFGYATLYVETAGYAPGGDDRGSQAAIPIADRERVLSLVAELEGATVEGLERPPKRVRRRYAARYLIALGVVVGALVAVERLLLSGLLWYAPLALLPVVPVAAHLKWRHRGYALAPDHVLTRNGVLRRRIKVVPYYRVQTVIDSRSLFQRRWSLATVTADTAGSLSLVGADAAAVDVDDRTAARLRETLSDRLYEALDDRIRERRIAPPGADGWRPERRGGVESGPESTPED